MAKGADVLNMLCPDSKWVIYGDDYDSINWFDSDPVITKQEFLAGFAKYDAWQTEQEIAKAEQKAAVEAKLIALGLTGDDLKALGLG